MRNLLDAAADLVTGSACVGCLRPGRLLCRDCLRELHGVPVTAPPAWAGGPAVHAAGAYAGCLAAAVVGHKERGLLGLAPALGSLLAGAVVAATDPTEAQEQQPAGECRRVLLVPVPSANATVRSRGHDPLRRTACAAAGTLRRRGVRARVVPALGLVRRVADQAGLHAGERAANLAGAMALTPSGRRGLAAVLAPGVDRLVLVDDVVTTGATLAEAARALAAGGFVPSAAATAAATPRRHPPGRVDAITADPYRRDQG